MFLVNGEFVNINTSVDIFDAINKILRDRNELQNSHIEKITIRDSLNPPEFPISSLQTSVGVFKAHGDVFVIKYDLLTEKEKKKLRFLLRSIERRLIKGEKIERKKEIQRMMSGY